MTGRDDRPRILCMYSGGLDSAGVLHLLLSDPRYAGFAVHIHHMHLVNRENRALAEKTAVERTLHFFKSGSYRSFVATESLHNYSFMRRDFIWDMDLCAFMAGNISLADKRIRYVAMGRTSTDVESSSFNFQRRMERAQAIFKSVRMIAKNEAEYIFPVRHLTKRKIWDMLPDPLRRATWSCRRPAYAADRTPRPCGNCISCREMRKHIPEYFVTSALGDPEPEGRIVNHPF